MAKIDKCRAFGLVLPCCDPYGGLLGCGCLLGEDGIVVVKLLLLYDDVVLGRRPLFVQVQTMSVCIQCRYTVTDILLCMMTNRSELTSLLLSIKDIIIILILHNTCICFEYHITW